MFLKNLKVSLQFLTIIPLGKKEISPEELGRTIPYFPLAGLVIGVFASLVYTVFLSPFFPRDVCDILILLLLVFLTGGLHLDGLSDMLDGLGSGKDRESSLRIMKDSRIGAFGTIGLIFAVLMKYIFLNNIDTSFLVSMLILMPVYGRWSILILGYRSQYAGQERGLGTVFVEKTDRDACIKGSVIALLASLIVSGLRGLVILGLVFALVFLLKRYFEKRLGGVTGDIYGAVIELSEITALLIALITQ